MTRAKSRFAEAPVIGRHFSKQKETFDSRSHKGGWNYRTTVKVSDKFEAAALTASPIRRVFPISQTTPRASSYPLSSLMFL